MSEGQMQTLIMVALGAGVFGVRVLQFERPSVP